jgi:hypothetical protein
MVKVADRTCQDTHALGKSAQLMRPISQPSNAGAVRRITAAQRDVGGAFFPIKPAQALLRLSRQPLAPLSAAQS